MKPFTLFLLLFLGLSTFSLAQPPDDHDHKEKREQIHAQKIAFIATQLNLTTEEAQKFWPVYNKYDAEIDTVRKERRGYLRELRKEEENMTGDRAYELMEKIFLTEKKESDIRLNYLHEFSTILGKKKAAMVFIAEEKFKRELIGQLKNNGHNPPNNKGGH